MGAVGLFINTELAEPLYRGKLPNSWGVLFDPSKSGRLANCGVTLLPRQVEVFSIWMHYKGHSLGNSGPRRITKVATLIRNTGVGIAPTDFATYIDIMRSGRACAGMAWGGMVNAANEHGKLRFPL